jgi:putative ABC transport system ATP-binding protein
VLLVGPSGSGKTTLLNVISALDAPTSGSYHFGGELVPHDDVEAMTAFRRRNVGYVFQFFNLLGDLTALENILLVQELTGGRDEPRAKELLALVGLAGLEERFPSEMSGGQQQRVAIARSLAKTPRLLLGDEPTGNLDSETTRQVMEVLVDACRAEKITAVLVSHDHALERYATRVISIDSGKLVEDRPGELATVKGAVKEAGRSSRKALKSLAEKARQFSQR